MNTCSMNQFLESLEPWLSDNYIRKGRIDENGDVVLMFNDGVNNVYRITDCTRAQLDGIIEKIRSRGIAFEARNQKPGTRVCDAHRRPDPVGSGGENDRGCRLQLQGGIDYHEAFDILVPNADAVMGNAGIKIQAVALFSDENLVAVKKPHRPLHHV